MNCDCRLNGRRARETDLRDLFRAVSDPEKLATAGGFLFKAHFPPPEPDGSPGRGAGQKDPGAAQVFFGIVPVIMETQRNYHFSITLGTDALPQVVGGFPPDGTVQALCPPPEGRSWKDHDLPLARFQVGSLCGFLAAFGYPPSSRFDWITLTWFQEAGLYGPGVTTVGDAALR